MPTRLPDDKETFVLEAYESWDPKTEASQKLLERLG